ncbi:MAG: sulfotransferase [Nostoc sp.]
MVHSLLLLYCTQLRTAIGDLKYVYAGFSRWQIYYLLMKKAQLSGEKGRKLGGYIYDIPNQWQGRVKNLQVIGDKHGEGTTLRIQANSRYISRLRNIINVNIKFIHIVRNPYDNITTMAKKNPEFNRDLNKSINYYFSLCDTIAQFKTTINSDDIFECKHELFINDPKNQLKNLCDFLGVEASDDYLNDCAKVVYKSPHKARYDVDWNSELIDLVKNRIEQFSFLHGYSYED